MLPLAPSLVRPWLALCVVGALCVGPNVNADRVDPDDVKTYTEPRPKRLEGVEIREQLGAKLPTGFSLAGPDGKPLDLSRAIDGDRPTILTFNYANCPMLCSLELTGLVEALKQLDWSIGKEFQILTVSLDPTETPEKASEMKARYLEQYGRPEAGMGWHFARSSEPAIQAMTQAVGFGYAYNEARQEYLHPAAVLVLSPDGRVMRYLYGIEYDAKTVRLSLVEAAHGKMRTTLDRVLLYCFHFDAAEGKYAPAAMNLMRLGGGLTVIAIGSFLGLSWLREGRRRRSSGGSPGRSNSEVVAGR